MVEQTQHFELEFSLIVLKTATFLGLISKQIIDHGTKTTTEMVTF